MASSCRRVRRSCSVAPQGTEIRGAVVLTGDGASVIPLHELLTQGLVPQIRPQDVSTRRSLGARPQEPFARLRRAAASLWPSVVARVARVDVLGVDARAARRPARRAPSAPSPPGRRGSRSGARSAGGTAPAGSASCPARGPATPAGTVSPRQSSGSCGVSSTAYSTRPSRSCQRVSMSRTVSRTSSSNRSPRVGSSGRPGSAGAMAGPRMPRPRRSRVRSRSGGRPRRAHTPEGSRTRVPQSAFRAARRYRRRRESRPALFAHCVRPRRGHHADLRVRRPDGRRRPARDVRRAALLRPLRRHGQRLSAPRGWEVLRLAPDPSTIPPSTDDLLALADAVREAGRPMVEATRAPHEAPPTGAGRETGRRGHLRMLTSE